MLHTSLSTYPPLQVAFSIYAALPLPHGNSHFVFLSFSISFLFAFPFSSLNFSFTSVFPLTVSHLSQSTSTPLLLASSVSHLPNSSSFFFTPLPTSPQPRQHMRQNYQNPSYIQKKKELKSADNFNSSCYKGKKVEVQIKKELHRIWCVKGTNDNMLGLPIFHNCVSQSKKK